MKVRLFISWSKPLSFEIAEQTKNFLEDIFHVQFETLLFDVEAGKRVALNIDEGLMSADLGIVILTKENFKEEWLLFETGALHVKSKEATAIPIKFEDDRAMENPINDLMPFSFNSNDFKKLCYQIEQLKNDNLELNDKQKVAIDDYFSIKNTWKNYEAKVSKIIKEYKPKIDIIDRATKDTHRLITDESAYDYLDSKRERQLSRFINDLENNTSKRIIFFGGVSSILRTEKAMVAVSVWLTKNSHQDSKVFYCHESLKVAATRAKQLKLTAHGDQFTDEQKSKQATIDKKIKEFQTMKILILKKIGKEYQKSILFTKLNLSLTIYITIDGIKMYLTPVLEKRSSNTFTFDVKPLDSRLQLLDYMEERTNNAELREEINIIRQEIQTKITKGKNNE